MSKDIQSVFSDIDELVTRLEENTTESSMIPQSDISIISVEDWTWVGHQFHKLLHLENGYEVNGWVTPCTTENQYFAEIVCSKDGEIGCSYPQITFTAGSKIAALDRADKMITKFIKM